MATIAGHTFIWNPIGKRCEVISLETTKMNDSKL